eukprot:scaffold9662_cov102-Isochrysis_galbana.AAC.1
MEALRPSVGRIGPCTETEHPGLSFSVGEGVVHEGDLKSYASMQVFEYPSPYILGAPCPKRAEGQGDAGAAHHFRHSTED